MIGNSKICLLLFKEINTFIQQGCIKFIKSDSKDIHYVSIDLFQINSFVFTFYSSKNCEKKSVHNNIKQHKCF